MDVSLQVLLESRVPGHDTLHRQHFLAGTRAEGDAVCTHRFWAIHHSTRVNAKAIASVTRDFRGRQIAAVKGHNEKLEVSRSHLGLFKGM